MNPSFISSRQSYPRPYRKYTDAILASFLAGAFLPVSHEKDRTCRTASFAEMCMTWPARAATRCANLDDRVVSDLLLFARLPCLINISSTNQARTSFFALDSSTSQPVKVPTLPGRSFQQIVKCVPVNFANATSPL